MFDFLASHTQAIITIMVLIWTIINFIREKMPAFLTALIAMAALMVVGILETNEVLSVFSNSAPITIAAMFIIGASLQATGVIDVMVEQIIRFATKNFSIAITLFFTFVLISSAFLNNTLIVIILTPVIIKLAKEFKRYPSKYLIPLSYIAIMGGTCSLIGTSTNLLINGILQQMHMPTLNIFDITLPGLLMAIVSIAFLVTIGTRLLPQRTLFTEEILTPNYGEKFFFAFGMVLPESPFINRTLADIIASHAPSVVMVDIIRNEKSLSEGLIKDVANIDSNQQVKLKALKLGQLLRNTRLEPYDRVIFRACKDDLLVLSKFDGITFGEHQKYLQFKDIPESIVLEGIIGPGSKLINNTISSSWIHRRYNCHIWAIHRQGEVIDHDFQKSPLKFGDVVLIEGTPRDLVYFFRQEDILNFTQFQKKPFSHKGFISISTILAVIILSAFNLMPISGAAIIGAITVIATNCISTRQAYESVDWRILMLIFGMLALSLAVEKTGIAAHLIYHFAAIAQQYGPLAILAMIYFSTSLITEFMTNSAAAVLITPIVIGLTAQLGLNPQPFTVAIMFAASASFATPLGYQTNTYVYNAGNYQFKDFLKIGIPMNIINFLTAMLVIPLFWPLQS